MWRYFHLNTLNSSDGNCCIKGWYISSVTSVYLYWRYFWFYYFRFFSFTLSKKETVSSWFVHSVHCIEDRTECHTQTKHDVLNTKQKYLLKCRNSMCYYTSEAAKDINKTFKLKPRQQNEPVGSRVSCCINIFGIYEEIWDTCKQIKRSLMNGEKNKTKKWSE